MGRHVRVYNEALREAVDISNYSAPSEWGDHQTDEDSPKWDEIWISNYSAPSEWGDFGYRFKRLELGGF